MNGKPELPKSTWTYPAIVRRQAQRYGSRTFCTFDDGKALSFAAFDAESDCLASALAVLGVKPGDRVMALLYNSREFLLVMLATHKRGAIFVPINTELKGEFLNHQLRNAQPRVVFVHAQLRPAFDSVTGEGKSVEATVIVDGDALALAGSTAHRFENLAAQPHRAGDVLEAVPQDVCTIMFTSGTTGPAKGVLMPHAHCFYNAWIAMRKTNLDDQDRMYIAMPLFHGTAALLQLYASLLAGASVHVVKRFSASAWLSDVRACAATVTYAAGVMVEFLMKQPPSVADAQNTLRLVWAVPVSDQWGLGFERRFGVRLLQAYGMTETCVPVWGDLDDALTAGCAGRVVEEFFEVRIVDPQTDEPLVAGQIGEIVTRPKEPGCFMAGYFRMADKTVEAWRNLWFHTGDAGYFDADARLFYVDRIRDRIRRRGENISAFEVEEALCAHPWVQECAVVGVKVEGAGGEDEVLAQLVADSTRLTPVELMNWCVSRIPRYALPRFIEFVKEIEKTPTGKVRKQAIRDAGVRATTWDREAAGYVVPR